MSGLPQETIRGNGERAKRWLRVVAAVCVVAGSVLAVKYSRHYVLPRRFAVVEPGHVYRGGRQHYWPYCRLVEQHGIRTIVTLLEDHPEDAFEQTESRVAAERNLRVLRFPMPGDGVAPLEVIDAAADALADPDNQPVFVHCAAGENRTGIVVAAYRLKHLGWPLEKVLAEAAEHGITPERRPELIAHIRRYYEQYVAAGGEASGRMGGPADAEPRGGAQTAAARQSRGDAGGG